MNRAPSSSRTAATWLARVAVLGLTVLVLLPRYLVGVTPHDEGFIATGAMLVQDGKLPYRDFLSFYGPAQYYLLAGLFSVFGQDLLVLRVLHVAWLTGLAALVCTLARRIAGRASHAPAVVLVAFLPISLYALPSPGYPAVPSSALLLAAALALDGWRPGASSRRLLVASLLVGGAGLFRWDFGLFGLAALSVAVGAALWRNGASARVWALDLCRAWAPSLGAMALVYVPLMAIAIAPRQYYDDIVRYVLFDVQKWRGIPFVRPAYWELLADIRHHRWLGALESATRIGYVAVPLAASLLAIGWLTVRRPQGPSRPDWVLPLYLAVLDLLLLRQMQVRATLWQGYPAVVTALPILVFLAIETRKALPFPRIALWGTRAAAAIVVVELLVVASPRAIRAVVAADVVSLDSRRATRIRMPEGDDRYPELVRHVALHTPKGARLFSGAWDHSRLFTNDSLIYFLSDRRPADRFVELDAGIANTVDGQQELRRALAAHRVPVLVLVELDPQEPNLTASSNGVHLLDEYIREHYEQETVFGRYTVWRRIAGSGEPAGSGR